MTQEQLKAQFLEYAEYNLNNETILESINAYKKAISSFKKALQEV